jgi:hypothetical protein
VAEQKTKPSGEDVEQFLSGIGDEKKRQDSFTLLEIIKYIKRLEDIHLPTLRSLIQQAYEHKLDESA